MKDGASATDRRPRGARHASDGTPGENPNQGSGT